MEVPIVTRFHRLLALVLIGAAILLPSVISSPAAAEPASTKRTDLLIIGDRLIDVAYHLGVIPAAMSARGGIWPLARDLGRRSSRLLGCPNCVVKRNPTAIPDAVRKLGIRRILFEKSPEFCLYRPHATPESVIRHLESTGMLNGMGVTIDAVDFGKGIVSAIRQTGTLLDRPNAAEALIHRYEDRLTAVKASIPRNPVPASIAVFNGVYQHDTGKAFVRLEKPGGYSGRFLLAPLGLVDVGDRVVAEGTTADMGLVPLRRLDGLLRAAPDIIVVTGDPDAFQRLLARETKRRPALRDIPAVRNAAIYALPRYVDSGVIEYPDILRRWAAALSHP